MFTAQRNPAINSSGWEEQFSLQVKLLRAEFPQQSAVHNEKYWNLNAHPVSSFSRTCQVINQHKSVCNASTITSGTVIHTSWASIKGNEELALPMLKNQSLLILMSASASPCPPLAIGQDTESTKNVRITTQACKERVKHRQEEAEEREKEMLKQLRCFQCSTVL